ncbi:D-arabinose 1-dehydrogenase [NAD(P)+]-like protein [Trichocladium antarcticum]|uniref:D-arabinose 1-dehydrogenase [NAD(P)+]-like protein n=1 Tax=Trichocladium antarcticum TaxID=1450529 RepID=A0AAN6ZDS9_9PEZI|nr:D-arabinose 1-dehydrogenase [NAD(P)+]-like protein [Trichocladium antarcticum]
MGDGSKPPTASPAASALPPLHAVLPPLVLGTATFNTQYVADPHSMPYRDIVARALSLGVNAFDTSPYYGPSELLLGDALDTLMNPPPSPHPTAATPATPVPRSSFFLITKAGRVAATEFDYSPAWIRYSVLRSLQRLHTPYLDLVYTHDAEFVTPREVLAAVRELRRLRDEEGLVRYVGISGFPVDVLCGLAEMVYAETGEPVDAVMSYGNFTVQNRRLGLPFVDARGVVGGEGVRQSPLARLRKAGVDVVLNASMLGMGLLTSRGIPAGPQTSGAADEAGNSMLAQWHPSPPELRVACKKLAGLATAAGERLESVAIRWALAEWARVAAAAGFGVDMVGSRKIGATVCGVSRIAELEETVTEWRGVLASLGQIQDSTDEAYGAARQGKILDLVQQELWPALGSWIDYVWESPGDDFVNTRRECDRGNVPDDGVIAAYESSRQGRQTGQSTLETR